jgi:D-alanyl-D-alanine carboxypeptidase
MLYRLLSCVALAASAVAGQPRDISVELEAVRAKWELPACASAVVKGGTIVAIGASGVRRADSDVRVTIDDIWHTGSCTKSMTAAVIGALVDEGKLRWETPVPEALPGLPAHEDWQRVTVWHVVTQTSGLSAGSMRDWRAAGQVPGSTPREQRENFARRILAQAPARPPGKSEYSNSGYGLLGAIIERATGRSYEEALHACIFQPLGLKTAGFGAPATPGKLDQPWGHRRDGKRLVPVEPLPENQFPLTLAPAGSVRMSLRDFARYASWLSTGEPRLVKPETFARLRTPPPGGNYAGGLWTSVLPGIGGDAVCHTGHMGGLFAVFYANREVACVSVFNVAGGGWEWLGDEVVAAALKAAAEQ